MNTGSTGSNTSNTLTFTNGTNTSSSTGTLSGTFTGTGKAADATSLTVKIKRNATLSDGILGLGAVTVDFDDEAIGRKRLVVAFAGLERGHQSAEEEVPGRDAAGPAPGLEHEGGLQQAEVDTFIDGARIQPGELEHLYPESRLNA